MMVWKSSLNHYDTWFLATAGTASDLDQCLTQALNTSEVGTVELGISAYHANQGDPHPDCGGSTCSAEIIGYELVPFMGG